MCRTGARKRRCSRPSLEYSLIHATPSQIFEQKRDLARSLARQKAKMAPSVRNNNNEFTAKMDELETTTRGLNDKRKISKTGLASVPMETPSINGCESIQKIDLKKLLPT